MYEFYNQNNIILHQPGDEIRQQPVEEFQMPAEFAGKLNFYVSAVDELMKQEDDNPTIGLLICKSKDDTVVEWSFRGMNQPLGVAEYELRKDIDRIVAMLPTESDVKNVIDTYPLKVKEDETTNIPKNKL